jgi:hypothetical protein
MTQLSRVLIVLMLGLGLVACGSDPKRPAKPDPKTQTKSVDVGPPFCQQLTVPVRARERVGSWSWDSSAGKWVNTWGPWSEPENTTRAATAADCLTLVDTVPANAVLPDLQIKSLERCGKGDLTVTGGDCFMIVNPAPLDKDFPSLEGLKLLKFPVITLNTGPGPSEIIADRSAKDESDWKAYQSFYSRTGKRLGSMYTPGVEFYFAGDGHDHWHVRDFDMYEIHDVTGKEVAHAEKHGYCMQDNTTYDTMAGLPGVPPEPGVYLDGTSCGKGLPNALNVIHGLSRGWGDTYPVTLPDQAIDISGLPDGEYDVHVHADVHNFVRESNEKNNTTSMRITIKGDEVTTHPETSVGGVH